jgi:hypothetical protein
MALASVPPDNANSGDAGHITDHNLIRAGLLELDAEKADKITVQDENGNVSTDVTRFDFQGAGVTASAGSGEVVITIPGGGTGSPLTVQDENGNVGTSVTQIDFQGAGVTAAAGSGEVVVTIPGSSGISGVTVQDDGVTGGSAGAVTTINFASNITASVSGNTATVAATTGGSGISGITVREESVAVGTAAGITSIDFVGAGVTATGSGGNATVTIPGGGSSTTYGVDGFDTWSYSNTTSASGISTGTFRMDSTTFASITTLWTYETSSTASDRSGILKAARPGDVIIARKTTDSTIWVRFKVISVTDSGTYDTFVVVPVASSGALSGGDVFAFSLIPGAGIQTVEFSFAGALAVGDWPYRWYNDAGEPIALLYVRASLGTTSSSGNVLADVKKNGTTVLATSVNVTAGSQTTKTTGNAFSSTLPYHTVADAAYLTAGIATSGAGTNAQNLTIVVGYI